MPRSTWSVRTRARGTFLRGGRRHREFTWCLATEFGRTDRRTAATARTWYFNGRVAGNKRKLRTCELAGAMNRRHVPRCARARARERRLPATVVIVNPRDPATEGRGRGRGFIYLPTTSIVAVETHVHAVCEIDRSRGSASSPVDRSRRLCSIGCCCSSWTRPSVRLGTGNSAV